jgi:hypothetical protein
MDKFLTKAVTFIPLLPPIGDIPPEQRSGKNQVESMSWVSNDTKEEIKFLFRKPIKGNDTISQTELQDFFHYQTEITTTAETIEEAANRSIFILEQVLDTSSLYSQAASKILEFTSIVNLTQIEDVIENKCDNFEKGMFKRQKLIEVKSFPPARLVFLTEQGIRTIGQNIFWFRRGLGEFSILNRFVSFFTALKELHNYFNLAKQKDPKFPLSLEDFLVNQLKLSSGSYENWKDIRNKIIHFSSRKQDYRKLNVEIRKHISELYKACYFGIMRFITDNPPLPSSLLFFEDLEKETIKATPEIVLNLKEIWKRRSTGLNEIIVNNNIG